jgi:hypothetical protein
MKISLNQLVQLTSSLAGQPFSVPVQEQLKVIYNYKRADWLQKILDKHPEQRKYFLKTIEDSLVDVDEAECSVKINCTVKRTANKIPAPVRTTETLFDYVGDPDKLDGYTYTTPEQLYYILKHGSKYTKDRPKYFYANEYIYIYNESSLENIGIRGIWADQRQLSTFKCNDVACYTDDDQYDVADDIVNTMVQDVLKNELKLLTIPSKNEVKIDTETNN